MKVELPFLAEGIEGGDVVLVLVHEGDQVSEGQSLVELETDKATVPVPSPAAGKIARLLVREGDHVKVGQALVELDSAHGAEQSAKTTTPEKPAVASAQQPTAVVESTHVEALERSATPPAESSSPAPPKTEESPPEAKAASAPSSSPGAAIPAPPSVRRLARELAVDLTQVKGTEAGGRITAEDVKAFVRERTRRSGVASAAGTSESGGVFHHDIRH